MKKLLSTLLVVALAVAMSVVAFGCNATEKKLGSATAWYGSVGMEKHSYFPYSKVTVDGDGNVTDIEIGEAFGPTGKAYITWQGAVTGVAASGQSAGVTVDGGLLAYNNPWYPGFGAIWQAYHAVGATTEAKAAAIAGHYIKVGTEVFQLKAVTQYFGNAQATILVFGNDTKTLTDNYLAKNIEWYVTAIKEGKIGKCNATGTIDTTATPTDGAYLKNHASSTYQPTRGLNGENFIKAMKVLENYAKTNKCKVDAKKLTTAGNYEGLRIEDLTSEDSNKLFLGEGATVGTASYLQYHVSYLEVAEHAYNLALGMRTLA